MKIMYRFSAIVLFVLLCLIIQPVRAQLTIPPDTTTYWMKNDRGVIIPFHRNADSTMIKGQLIIKFRQNILDYDKLTNTYLDYYYYRYSNHDHKGGRILTDPSIPNDDTLERGFPPDLVKILRRERFYFDSTNNIVQDPALKSFLLLEGGSYLRRLTTASPVDTLSLTRRGDTIGCDHYNWMVLKFDTTVNPLVLSYVLMTLYPKDIVLALPDRMDTKLLRDSLHPSDNRKFFDTCEYDMTTMINVERAWYFEVGNPKITLGLYDLGCDYRHIDLGGDQVHNNVGLGKGYHILYGEQFSISTTGSMDDIFANQGHGTPSMGIMGALTNRNSLSVAGVAGGWGTLHPPLEPDTVTDRGTGCSLAILACSGKSKSAYIAAIFEAAAHSVSTRYGYGLDAINTSAWIVHDGMTEPDLHGAINYAYENGVVQVAAIGEGGGHNETGAPETYPADYEEPWMISVGGSVPGRTWMTGTNYGYTMDIIAPAGDPTSGDSITGCYHPGSWSLNYSTMRIPENELSPPTFVYTAFGGTSAAAPHVTGSAGLILSHFYNDSIKLEPEDVAGMLKSAAWRGNDTSRHSPHSWSSKSGYGHLDIGHVFEMLDPDPMAYPDSRYQLHHYSYSDSLQYSDWTTMDSTPYIFDVSWSPYIHQKDSSGHNIPDSSFLKTYKNRDFLLDDNGGGGGRNIYYARVRNVTRTVHLDSIWEVDSSMTPLFAWGRSGGINEKSGWNPSQYNWQSGWSTVSDGKGGNPLNEGIFHSDSTTFVITTAQFDVWAYNDSTHSYSKYIGHCPRDSMMGVNFSVFGRLNDRHTSSVKDNQTGNPDLMITVRYKANNVIATYYLDKEIIHPKLEIFDILGKPMTTMSGDKTFSGWNSTTCPITLASGTYICRISGAGVTQSRSFQVRR